MRQKHIGCMKYYDLPVQPDLRITIFIVAYDLTLSSSYYAIDDIIILF